MDALSRDGGRLASGVLQARHGSPRDLVAAHTRRIGLGTSVLNMPFYNPVKLARRLATLDALAARRLRVGLGQAWSADELEAAGAPPGERGSRADEFLGAVKVMWGDDPVEFRGKHFRVAPSFVGLKPVQTPHPPRYLVTDVPAALRRAAVMADGWLPSMVPPDALGQMLPQFPEIARAAGQDPARLDVIHMSTMKVDPPSTTEARHGFLSESARQVGDDVRRLRELGVTELLWMGFDAGTLDEDLAPSGAPPRGRRVRSMNPTTRRRLSCLTPPRPRFDHRADTAPALARGW